MNSLQKKFLIIGVLLVVLLLATVIVVFTIRSNDQAQQEIADYNEKFNLCMNSCHGTIDSLYNVSTEYDPTLEGDCDNICVFQLTSPGVLE